MHSIYRYSRDGFKEQHQDHLLKDSKITLDDMLNQCPNDYMKDLIKSSYVSPDPTFEYDGIFIFLNNPTIEDKEFYLNHLNTDLNEIPLHSAQIEKSAICYLDDGFVFRKENKMTIEDAVNKCHNVVYLPASQISKIQIKRKNKLKY